MDFPCGSAGKKSACNVGDPGSIPGKIPWRRERLSTPVFWPRKFHDSIVLGVAKSWTRLSNFHYHKHSTSFFEKQNPEKQGRQTLKTNLQSFRSLTLEWQLVECESQSIDIYRMPVWLHFSGVVAKKDHSPMLFSFFTQSMALLSSSGLSLTWQQVSIMALWVWHYCEIVINVYLLKLYMLVFAHML